MVMENDDDNKNSFVLLNFQFLIVVHEPIVETLYTLRNRDFWFIAKDVLKSRGVGICAIDIARLHALHNHIGLLARHLLNNVNEVHKFHGL